MLTENQKRCKHEWNKYIEAVFCGKPLFEYHCALCSLDLEELLKSKYRQGFNEGIDEAILLCTRLKATKTGNNDYFTEGFNDGVFAVKIQLENLKRSG